MSATIIVLLSSAMPRQASIASDSISAGEGNHKVFSKEISGKLVVDLLFQRVSAVGRRRPCTFTANAWQRINMAQPVRLQRQRHGTCAVLASR